MFYYLAYLRPLIGMMLRTCFHITETSNLVFVSNPIAAGKPQYRHWNTSEFTQHLRRSTQDCLGTSIGSQKMRQLMTAVTVKHIDAIARPIRQYDDRSPNAGISVVLAWQSGHGLAQRSTSEGLDGALSHTLQPKLLRLHECASNQWHGFLGLLDAVEHVPQPRPDQRAAFHQVSEIDMPVQSAIAAHSRGLLSSNSHAVLGERPNPPSAIGSTIRRPSSRCDMSINSNHLLDTKYSTL